MKLPFFVPQRNRVIIRKLQPILVVLLLLALIAFGVYHFQLQSELQTKLQSAQTELVQSQENEAELAEAYYSGSVIAALEKLDVDFRILAREKTVVEAVVDFAWGFENIPESIASTFPLDPLEDYYRDSLLPQLGSPDDEDFVAAFVPQSARASYLQAFYLANQTHLDRNHPYHYVPQYFGPFLSLQLERPGWTNFYLLDRKGHVIYAAKPDWLLGESPQEIKDKQPGLSRLVLRLLEEQDSKALLYEPEFDQQGLGIFSYSGCPIMKDGKLQGYLALSFTKSLFGKDSLFDVELVSPDGKSQRPHQVDSLVLEIVSD